MVQMFNFKFNGESTHDFTHGQIYVGRTAKSGVIMARTNSGEWMTVQSFRFTISRLWCKFEIINKFTVNNHKEALAYQL